MIPVHLVDMTNLQQTSDDVSQEMMKVINKNAHKSFCAPGADYTLEHLNCAMRFAGGLVGIALNESAHSKFFIISPELARLSEEAKHMTGFSPNAHFSHHGFSASAFMKHEEIVHDLCQNLGKF